MKRREYHNIAVIQDFLTFLVKACKDNGFCHTWASFDTKSTGIKKGQIWECHSILDAAAKYYWPASAGTDKAKVYSLAETSLLLDNLSTQLQQAVDASDVELTKEVCNSILYWGGVSRYPNVARDFRQVNFPVVAYLKAVRTALTSEELDSENLTLANGYIFKLDSGLTKIYALLYKKFVIFDSRVGCALALLARQFWSSCGNDISTLPKELRFLWSGDQIRRNPNLGEKAIFPKFAKSRSALRIQQNIEVSWLILELAKRIMDEQLVTATSTEQVSRQIEAGLFMIGYGVTS